ncbi:hypothetical protein KY285_019711 [Solanum tuberosum]|nr:hypothetical protein KY285_019711 [Solanum tuberosum]
MLLDRNLPDHLWVEAIESIDDETTPTVNTENLSNSSDHIIIEQSTSPELELTSSTGKTGIPKEYGDTPLIIQMTSSWASQPTQYRLELL